MDGRLLKPVPEVTYLTTGNAWRYRAILRYFYLQHERLRHFLFPEEIFTYLKQYEHFHDYSEEQLEQDLAALVQWQNLIPRQDTGKVNSIEEFKKKRFRYQCAPYTIKIERMVQELESMGESFGGSLERTVFDDLFAALTKLTARKEVAGSSVYEIETMANEEIYSLWEGLFDDFRKLTENATDYLAHLQSEQVEQMMQTESFLVYKDAVTGYLRNFMSALQRFSFRIETILLETPDKLIFKLVERVTEYYLNIPRLDITPDREDAAGKYRLQWRGMKEWFLGSSGRESDLLYLQNVTNETIRRITRFAQRLGERHHNLRSRRSDYLQLARWFQKANSLAEAHKLAAVVFGVSHTRHIFAESRGSEDIHSSIWEEQPTVLTLNPRVRNYRQKTRPGAIESHKSEKAAVMEEFLQRKEAEDQLMQQLLQNGRIVIAELPVVTLMVRKTILMWLSRTDGAKEGKTETGRRYKVIEKDKNRIRLQAEDGLLEMPNYVLEFIE